MIIGLLALLVALQAVPTYLWVKQRLSGSGLPVVSAAAAPTFTVPAMSTAAPCDATPAPAETTPAPAPSHEEAVRASAAAPQMVAGLMSVAAPVALNVYAGNRMVGTTEADTIMLPVGTHDLVFENASVGYRARRSITIQAGKTANLRLDAPPGTVHVNAVPWAEVWIDNQRVGETPIGNHQVSIGRHEVVFRHPDLGERKTTVLVTLKEPARVSMDLRTK